MKIYNLAFLSFIRLYTYMCTTIRRSIRWWNFSFTILFTSYFSL